MFVLVCHGIKKGLYAFFKSHRKEWNNIADREEMEEHIAQNLGQIQKKVQEKSATVNNQKEAYRIYSAGRWWRRKDMMEIAIDKHFFENLHEFVLKY